MTAIICIALFLGGFFFPPYGSVLLVTSFIYGKQESSGDPILFKTTLKRWFESRKKKATVQNLYFEAAQAFAEDHGGHIFPEDQDTISCTVVIGGKPHTVSFMRERKTGGTYVQIAAYVPLDISSPENLRKSEEARLEELMKSLRQ